jgi:hypothetical protein
MLARIQPHFDSGSGLYLRALISEMIAPGGDEALDSARVGMTGFFTSKICELIRLTG